MQTICPLKKVFVCALLAGVAAIPGYAQYAELRPANPIRFPGISDSNVPVHRPGGRFEAYQSLGLPLLIEGDRQTSRMKVRGVFIIPMDRLPMWIESIWPDPQDPNTIYAWYHHEQSRCGNQLASPSIGALVSRDGGKNFNDLGIVLETGYPQDCNARNGYFSGGHGDFTVLLDRAGQYFYFYFSNYSGPLSDQGIAVARMAIADRSKPIGKVWKYYQGGWYEPGLRGRVTPILRASTSWSREDANAFWGPSLHWNTYLQQFVMLMNRTCCQPGWPQEGVYVAFNSDLSFPGNWTEPAKILEGERARWYPQVIGGRPSGSDREAGQTARFYMGGESEYEIVFFPR